MEERNRPVDTEKLEQELDRIASLRKPAEKGDVDGQFKLGRYWSSVAPRLVPREKSAIGAWYWTCLAATGGHPAAQSLVGFWLAQQGPNRRIPHVPRDLAKAYMWYSLSASTGRPTGKAGRDRIAGTMASAEIESAEKQLAEWEPNSEECVMPPQFL